MTAKGTITLTEQIAVLKNTSGNIPKEEKAQ